MSEKNNNEVRITGGTELVGLMAYPIRHTKSPLVHNAAYQLNGDNVIQLAFEVERDRLPAAVESIRALRMLGSNISMPNKTVVGALLDELDDSAALCGAVNAVVNLRDDKGQVTGRLKGYNTDGMGFWRYLEDENVRTQGASLVLIGAGGAASAIACSGALAGLREISIFNKHDDFFEKGEALCRQITEKTDCAASMHDLDDCALLRKKMSTADIFCDATGVGMHPLEDLTNIPDADYFRPGMTVVDTVYVPAETVMLQQARAAGCTAVYNGLGMMLYQALIGVELFTGKKTSVAEMKQKIADGLLEV